MTDAFGNLVSLAMLPGSEIPDTAREMARFSLFDWMVVGLAGRNEPLSHIILQLVCDEAGSQVATVFGGLRVPARAAALANGTISHALDYDDTHFAHIGHLSVGILPAAMAVGEEVDASAGTMVDAFLIGAEAAVRLGMCLGREHYQRGFHQTATAGAFGATVAAGRLLGLTKEQMRHALSLVATRASGLKSQFGTMGKPFNAGTAAANGVEAAKLAKAGFLSCDDGVFGPQGFVETHATRADLINPWQSPPPVAFLFEDIKYKLHACCHGTHAMIEALRGLKNSPVHADGVAGIRLNVNPRWLKVCNIRSPRSGLEIKFSYAWLAGMVFKGIDTSADKIFVDDLCSDPALVDFSEKVEVIGDPTVSDTATEGEVTTRDGRRIPVSFDLAAPCPISRS